MVQAKHFLPQRDNNVGVLEETHFTNEITWHLRLCHIWHQNRQCTNETEKSQMPRGRSGDHGGWAKHQLDLYCKRNRLVNFACCKKKRFRKSFIKIRPWMPKLCPYTGKINFTNPLLGLWYCEDTTSATSSKCVINPQRKHKWIRYYFTYLLIYPF